MTALTDSSADDSQYQPSRAPQTAMEIVPMPLVPAAQPAPDSAHVYRKLEAAVILRGVVRLVLDDGAVEVEPRTWYKERGTHYLEARRRDSGEHLVLRVDQIRDVMAY